MFLSSSGPDLFCLGFSNGAAVIFYRNIQLIANSQNVFVLQI
jgi:predicted esterase